MSAAASASVTIGFEGTDQGTVIMGIRKQQGHDELIVSPKYLIKAGFDSEDILVDRAKQILEDVMRASNVGCGIDVVQIHEGD